MVLENSSEPVADDPFYENSPPSDSDPYSSSSSSPATQTSQYHIDRSNFPKSLPIFGPLFGYDDKLFARVLQRKIEISTRSIERPVTSEEANAMAYYVAKNIAISSYGPPIGIAGGLWRAYNSAHEFRIPFFRPSPEFIQAHFMSKGPGRILLLHATRACLYAAGGKLVADFLFGSYGTSVSVVGELRDPRMKDLLSIMARRSKEKQYLPTNRTSRPVSSVGGATQSGGREQAQDDASPTGGMFADVYESTDSSEGATVVATALDLNPRSSGNTGTTQQADQTRRNTYGTARAGPPPPVPEAQEEAFDPFDDVPSSSSQNNKSTSGSAWDRLRRGGNPTAASRSSTGWQAVKKEQNSGQNAWGKQQTETQKEQRDGSLPGDSYAFSKTEEEEAYAKEEAQREFDARVERERRGGDFSQGAGDQKRW